jgi:hypothetical protein
MISDENFHPYARHQPWYFNVTMEHQPGNNNPNSQTTSFGQFQII